MASRVVGGHEAMASQRWWRVRCRGTVVWCTVLVVRGAVLMPDWHGMRDSVCPVLCAVVHYKGHLAVCLSEHVKDACG
jgi:hypothetical protein